MPDSILIRGYAKVNLSLAVLSRRADGYHELQGVMHRIGLYDTVELRPARGITVAADRNLPFDNTARRMAEGYCALTGAPGAEIFLHKNIPSKAGLGGASADAAAVLEGLETLYGRLRPGLRAQLAVSVGADVPFCLLGGTAFARGIGERLTPLDAPELPLVVLKGREGVSTAALFARLRPPYLPLNHEGMLEGLRRGDLEEVGRYMGNGLEAQAGALVPDIARLKALLLRGGALGACMTGAGSAVVGLFPDAARVNGFVNSLKQGEVCFAFPGATPVVGT